MTRQKSFKRLVRARMAKTGESYTTARRQLLSATTPVSRADQPALVTTDERIRERTGLGWETWFDLLDEAGGLNLPHGEIARWVAGKLDLQPLAWNVQAIATSYERARGIRDVGEHPDGFSVNASRTIAVPVEQVYDAVLDPALRGRWLPEAGLLRERQATRPKSAHFDWAGDESRLHVYIRVKETDKSVITIEHARLTDAAARDQAKRLWGRCLADLKTALESGELR